MKIVEATILTPITVSIVCLSIIVSMNIFMEFRNDVNEKHKDVQLEYDKEIGNQMSLWDKANEIISE